MESFSNFKPTINFVEEEDGNTSIRKSEMGEIHTCNLISINLAELTSEELEKYVVLAVRALDNIYGIGDAAHDALDEIDLRYW